MLLLDSEEAIRRHQQHDFWIKENNLCNLVLVLNKITCQRLNTNELTSTRTYKNSWAVWFCGIGKLPWKIHCMLIYCSKTTDWIATKRQKMGHRNSRQCVVQLHKGLCSLILFYLWPCLVVPSSWDQELWSHTDCQMAAGSPECVYWQTVGKNQHHRAIARCQHRGNELDPTENVNILAKTENRGVSKGLQIFSKWQEKKKDKLQNVHTAKTSAYGSVVLLIILCNRKLPNRLNLYVKMVWFCVCV